MTYYTKVLLVDDDPRYSKGLQDRAYIDYDIELIHYEDWEEARDELKDHNNKYAAVILDVMGKLDKDNKGDDPSHISTAIRDIARIDKDLKYYILTAFYKRINENNFIPPDEKIFKKNENEDELFKNIKEEFSSSERFIAAKKFPDELDFAERYFTDEQINDFVKVFGKDDDEVNDLRVLRILNERLMDVLGLYYLNFESIGEYLDEVSKSNKKANMGNRTIHFLDYFRKNSGVDVPSGIYGTVRNIYHTASEAGVHSPTDKEYKYSSTMIKSLKLGLLESICWVNEVLKKIEG